MHKVRTESLKLISDFTNQTLSGWLAVKAKELNTYHLYHHVEVMARSIGNCDF